MCGSSSSPKSPASGAGNAIEPGWCHKSGECAKSCARRLNVFLQCEWRRSQYSWVWVVAAVVWLRQEGSQVYENCLKVFMQSYGDYVDVILLYILSHPRKMINGNGYMFMERRSISACSRIFHACDSNISCICFVLVIIDIGFSLYTLYLFPILVPWSLLSVDHDIRAWGRGSFKLGPRVPFHPSTT